MPEGDEEVVSRSDASAPTAFVELFWRHGDAVHAYLVQPRGPTGRRRPAERGLVASVQRPSKLRPSVAGRPSVALRDRSPRSSGSLALFRPAPCSPRRTSGVG